MKYNTFQVEFSDESTDLPVTLTEAKNWCRVDISEDDTLITELIHSARQMLEGFLCISLISRTVTAVINNPLGSIELPYGPVVSFTSLTSKDGSTITSTNYDLAGLNFKWLNQPHDIEMTAVYTAGYDPLPRHFKTAILQQVLYLYENRGDSTAMDKDISPQIISAMKNYSRVC